MTAVMTVFTVTTVLAARVASAQSATTLQPRVDSLVRAWQTAKAAREAHEDSSHFAMRATDTVIVGPLRVLTTHRRAPLARTAADSVVARLTGYYATALDTLRSQFLVLRDEHPVDVDDPGDSSFVVVAALSHDGVELMRTVVVTQPDVVTSTLQNVTMAALSKSMDPAVQGWLESRLPSDTLSEDAWATLRVDLLSAGTAAARRCYAGSMADCRLALRLDEARDPLVQLFDSTDRRRIAEKLRGQWWRHWNSDACETGSDAQCIAALGGMESPFPVSSIHRAALLSAAMSVGGPGAMQRFMRSPGTLDDRLRAASGITADSLVAVWRAKLHGSMQASDLVSATTTTASVGWMLLLAGVAVIGAGRSRWR
ncbi:MAG TPA: hypothetical protein VJ867_13520 [Gemmatimonadaceae bacterium]|nr:hypothetical protein [Gemmatimonadaceae bacterium]